MKKILNYINELDFFKSLDESSLESLSQISNYKKYAKGSILYYENDAYNKLFFLVSGCLKVYKVDKFENEIFLYNIYKNSLISELATINNNEIYCFSNTEFIEDSIVLEVDFQQFKNQFLSQNILNEAFINEILLKTHQLHCVVNRELVFDATSKVAYMLTDDLEMFNKLKRSDVSFMLHIQPETLSRVLKKLKRTNIIDADNSKIIIKDRDALIQIYRGN